jgi:alpha-glucosidase
MFGDRRRNTSWAHQLTSAVVMGGEPMLTYAANPANLLSNPAVNVIRDIPAQWDETIVLPGSEIGEMAAFARRKGTRWFLAVMNGNTPRKIKISLNFLKGPAAATIVKDVPGNPAAVQMEQASLKPSDVITLGLEAGGGYLTELKL